MNSNLKIPDFPHDIRIKLAWSKKIVKFWQCYVSALLAVSTKLRQPTRQRQSNVRTQQKKINQANLILYYEENLVSSNLNSKLLRFHCAHPNLPTLAPSPDILDYLSGLSKIIYLNSIWWFLRNFGMYQFLEMSCLKCYNFKFCLALFDEKKMLWGMFWFYSIELFMFFLLKNLDIF